MEALGDPGVENKVREKDEPHCDRHSSLLSKTKSSPQLPSTVDQVVHHPQVENSGLLNGAIANVME